jgi:hypothetical protein
MLGGMQDAKDGKLLIAIAKYQLNFPSEV